MRFGLFVCAASVMCNVAAAQAASLPRYGTFIYSSLCWEKESGDAAGYRIQLIRSPAGDTLKLEWSEGPLEGPIAASSVNLVDSSIAFTVPEAGETGKSDAYSGVISDKAITLEHLPYGPGSAVVPRVRTVDTKIGECR